MMCRDVQLVNFHVVGSRAWVDTNPELAEEFPAPGADARVGLDSVSRASRFDCSTAHGWVRTPDFPIGPLFTLLTWGREPNSVGPAIPPMSRLATTCRTRRNNVLCRRIR